MVRRVIWSFAAASDVESIHTYLRQNSAQYASRFLIKIRDTARSLSSMPERGRRVPEYPELDIHELFVDSFRLIYRIKPEVTEIVGVVHMAHDLSQLNID